MRLIKRQFTLRLIWRWWKTSITSENKLEPTKITITMTIENAANRQRSYMVNKQEREDLVKIIYGWLLICFSGRSTCTCNFNIKHTPTFKRVVLLHFAITICKGICQKLDEWWLNRGRNSKFACKILKTCSANTTDETRLHVWKCQFYITYQLLFIASFWLRHSTNIIAFP